MFQTSATSHSTSLSNSQSSNLTSTTSTSTYAPAPSIPLPTSTSFASSKSLKIFFFNSRSLLPYLDELSALCTLHTPDVVCVVETWLSSDISDSELFLPNFQIFRLDRSRHGGGILVYVKSSLSASIVPVSSSIELLLLSLTFKHIPVSLATFYRPPSCPDDLNSLHNVLSSLAHSLTHNLILVGDFNVNYLSSSPLLNQLNVISDFFLS